MDQATYKKMKFLFEPVESIERFDEWLQYWIDVEFPWDTVDPESTSSPLVAMWDVYQFMLTGKGPSTHVIASCRNGFKTLVASGVHTFSMLQFRRDDAHIAATLNQSSAATRYLGQFYQKIGRHIDINQYIATQNFRTLELRNLPITDYTTKTNARAKIVTATLKGANSDRASCILADEADLTPQAIIDEFAFIADAAQPRHGVKLPTCFIYLSSRKTNSGPIQRLINRCEKTPEHDRLHKWSTSDMMEVCPPEKHQPEKPRIMAYINTSSLQTIWGEEEFSKLVQESSKSEWKPIQAYAGCQTCPVWIPCLTNSVKQQGTSQTLRSHDFVFGVHRNVSDPSYIIGQSLNWKPESKGLVYQQFSKQHHLKNPLKFYLWATGKVYLPDNIDTPEELDILIDEAQNDLGLSMLMPSKQRCYEDMVKAGWEFNIGVDWGSKDPATANVVGYHPKQKRACVLHYEQAPMPNHLWAQYVENNVANVFPPNLICPDLADASSATYFKKHSCFTEKYHIEPGVSFIRGLLWNPISATHDFCFYDDFLTNGENNNHIGVEAMEKWSHKRKPDGTPDLTKFNDDDYCHFGDSLRYSLAPYIKDAKVSVSFNQTEHKEVYSRLPTTEEELKRNQERIRLEQHMRDYLLEGTGVDIHKKPGSDKNGNKSGSIKFRF